MIEYRVEMDDYDRETEDRQAFEKEAYRLLVRRKTFDEMLKWAIEEHVSAHQLALCLELKSPAGHDWMSPSVAASLAEFAGQGYQAHRTAIDDYLHHAKYSTETRRAIKQSVVNHQNAQNGTIASRAVSAETYKHSPPESQIYQHKKILPLTGVTVLAGRPKMGKSYLALNLAIAIASGGVFISSFKMDYPGDVLYLALEDNDNRMWSRLCALVGNPNDVPSRLYFDYKAPTMAEGQLVREIKEWTERDDITEPRLIVIDVFRYIQSKRASHENLYENEYTDLSQLSQFANENGLHIIIITHLTKAYNTVDDVADSVMSSTAITAATTGIWILSHKGEEVVDAELDIRGKDIPKWTCALREIQLDDHIDWQAIGDSETVIQGNVQTEIITTLYQWSGHNPTQSELREIVAKGMDKGNFSRLLKKLKGDGLIRITRNRYGLTHQGVSTAEVYLAGQDIDSQYRSAYQQTDENESHERNDAPWENYVDDNF